VVTSAKHKRLPGQMTQ